MRFLDAAANHFKASDEASAADVAAILLLHLHG